MTRRPEYSPCEPALGWRETAAKPVISASQASRSLKSFCVAAGLFGRRERVQPAELGPGDGEHLARGVELHRARAERDHRVAEREVLRLQPADVAEHLVLGVIAVEHAW
jgi:hypothetical protein